MKAEQYFKDYPGKKECFQTSDGLIFHEEGDAKLHAQGLEDKEVEKHRVPVREETNQGNEVENVEEFEKPKKKSKKKHFNS